MRTIRDETYVDRNVDVDGLAFERCTFIRCRLYYRADELTQFKDCQLEECTWVFEGAADKILPFLSSVYRDTGEEGRSLIRTIVRAIEDGTFVGQTEGDRVATPA